MDNAEKKPLPCRPLRQTFATVAGAVALLAGESPTNASTTACYYYDQAWERLAEPWRAWKRIAQFGS